MPRTKSRRRRKGIIGTPLVTRSRKNRRSPKKDDETYVPPPMTATERAVRSSHSLSEIHAKKMGI